MSSVTENPTVPSPFAPIDEAVAAIGRGEMIIVVDDEDRENEGDLIMAAQFATEDTVAFIVNHTSGVICASVTEERADALDLPLMVADNTDTMRTAFTITVDYGPGVTTGISAAERAATIRALADPAVVATDFNRPGHVFPLRARPGGVLKRAGHTEAAIDLAVLAGLEPAGLLCEVVKPDGSMARLPDLVTFAHEHDLLVISIADLIRYRRRTEKLVQRTAEATIPTEHGDFQAVIYESLLDGEQHVALVKGDVGTGSPDDDDVLVRVHSECLTGDIFGSLRCDCQPQLHQALALVAEAGRGVVVYLRGHEGRGIGLAHKIRAYQLQQEGYDTVDANLELGLPADSREYGIGAQMLVDLGVTRMRLITNNPAKYGGLDGFGLEITARVPALTTPTAHNIAYLRTKQQRMGHQLDIADPPVAH